jgi:LAS superfamily LD-carboxypeptidase LdcB
MVSFHSSLNKDHPMKTQQSSSNKNLPSLSKDHPMQLTLPQQISSNENLPSLNKDHPMKMYPPSTKIIQRVSFYWMNFAEFSLDDLC